MVMTTSFAPPASYAEACEMMGCVVMLPNGEVACIKSVGAGDDISVYFAPIEGPHRWLAYWSSKRGFETQHDRKARLWDEGAAKLSATSRKMIITVLGDVFSREDRANLKDPARLANVAKVHLNKAGKLDYENCSRCGGSGHYSYNQISGTRCFNCNGKQFVFPSDSKALKAALRCEPSP